MCGESSRNWQPPGESGPGAGTPGREEGRARPSAGCASTERRRASRRFAVAKLTRAAGRRRAAQSVIPWLAARAPLPLLAPELPPAPLQAVECHLLRPGECLDRGNHLSDSEPCRALAWIADANHRHSFSCASMPDKRLTKNPLVMTVEMRENLPTWRQLRLWSNRAVVVLCRAGLAIVAWEIFHHHRESRTVEGKRHSC